MPLFFCYLMIGTVTMYKLKDINAKTCQIKRIFDMENDHPKNGYLTKYMVQSSRRLIISIRWSKGSESIDLKLKNQAQNIFFSYTNGFSVGSF